MSSFSTYQFKLNKETGKLVPKGFVGSSKYQILYMSKDLLVTKVAGYTGYVHRGIGSVYAPACVITYKVEGIYNHHDHILIGCSEIKTVDLKKIDDYGKEIAIQLASEYPETVSKIPKGYGDILKHNQQIYDELNGRIDKGIGE